MAAILATLSAIGFAAAAVSSKRGLQNVSTLGGVVISLPAGLAVAAVFAAFDPPEAVPLRALGFLALAGLLASGVGRLLVIAGLRRLDTAVYIPVQTSTHPLVAVIGGLLLLGERITPLRGVGALAIVAGIWVLTRTRTAPQLISAEGDVASQPRTNSALGVVLLFPIGAGLAFGGGDLSSKEAMLAMPHPAFGAAVSTFVSVLVWSVLIGASRRLRSQITFGPGKAWFVLYGIFSTLALICAYAALQRGDVSLVSPIIAAQPVAVLILSALLLRRIEVVTGQAVVGALLVVAGAVLVSVS